MVQLLILPIIAIVLTIVLFFFSLTVKGWRRWASIIVLLVFLVVQFIYIIGSQNEIKQIQDKLEEEKRRTKPESLSLLGYEIQGDKTGMRMLMYHSVVPRIKTITKAFLEKNYKSADKMCDSLIYDYPSSAVGYFWKGAVAIAKNEESKCESLWSKAVEFEPKSRDYALLYRNLGILRMLQGNTKGSIKAFKLTLSVSVSFNQSQKLEKEKGEKPFDVVSSDECNFLISKSYKIAGIADSAEYYFKKAIEENTIWEKKQKEKIKIIIP